MLRLITDLYGLPPGDCSLSTFGNGLINHTWLLRCGEQQFIVQRVNDAIFRDPPLIAENIDRLNAYLTSHFPGYLFVAPVKTIEGDGVGFIPNEGYFRMFPFVKGSMTYDIVVDAGTAYEAARQFGRFTALLSAFDATTLHTTVKDFHNLDLRYQQFEQALATGNPQRIAACEQEINAIKSQRSIVDIFNTIRGNSNFRQRVTHHDTKISNVLFDKDNKGLCVIDLDTVMPGYFISDVGDMMRTYLSPVSEEEKDFSKIRIRDDYFQALLDGYLSEMRSELSEDEKHYFVYSGKFMIYMQAIRFLADHLNDDIYYGAKYDGHNLVRAQNQLELLHQLSIREAALQARVGKYLGQEPAQGSPMQQEPATTLP